MASRLCGLVLALLSLSPLSGQEGDLSGTGDAPVSADALRRAALGRDLVWRPDWPLALPPDAFTPLSDPSVRAVTLSLEGEEYRARRGEAGYFDLFPVYLEGGFSQAALNGGLQGIRVSGKPGENSLDMEPLRFNEEALPGLVRIRRGGEVYFTVLEYGLNRVSETWYDREGGALRVITTRFPGPAELRVTDLKGGPEKSERYDYDSSGNITEINSSRGNFTALYDRNNRPRYWERHPAEPPEGAPSGGGEDPADPAAGPNPAPIPDPAAGPGPDEAEGAFTLQWDEAGFLVRITGPAGAADYRYEYTLDERGNWTERREIRMVPRAGFLAPVLGTTVNRVIEYETSESGAEPHERLR
jgi:YD repeat-containing protein